MIVNLIKGGEPDQKGSWNAVCLEDFGDTGVAFVALPQISPRNNNWASRGKWVHVAKIACEKTNMKLIGVVRLNESR